MRVRAEIVCQEWRRDYACETGKIVPFEFGWSGTAEDLPAEDTYASDALIPAGVTGHENGPYYVRYVDEGDARC